MYKPHKIFSVIALILIAGASAFYFSRTMAKQKNNSSENMPAGNEAVLTSSEATQRTYSTTASTASTATQTQPVQAAAPSPVSSAGDTIPVSIKISSINLIAPVVKTGLEANGALHVPSNPNLSGWYDLGPKPGEIGPSVITGHLDSAAGPGVFWNLKKVKVGDEVEVVRDDGSIAIFKVDKMQTYSQDNFNTQAVYGSISNAGLRIITCAGIYEKNLGHYSDDLVVYASLLSIQQPSAYQTPQ